LPLTEFVVIYSLQLTTRFARYIVVTMLMLLSNQWNHC